MRHLIKNTPHSENADDRLFYTISKMNTFKILPRGGYPKGIRIIKDEKAQRIKARYSAYKILTVEAKD